ncbi:HigA family addiction module antitoxin [Stenotrophomonas sp. PS02289]|uniref:HigA family addiction module antitoxin n=1 Tax=Stenotrophomonas sp. PS02289 TaxID=2991422 RepID=UPI00249B7D84|nr:HigA family addiction module antitoxin [Stenotrophomonas sp. PS02289]
MCEKCSCAGVVEPTNPERPRGAPESGAVAPQLLFHPPADIHPGRVLMDDYLRPSGISIRRLADSIRVKRGRLESIISGRSGISAELSMRLGRYFGDPPTYWQDLQSKHDMEMAYCAWGEDVDLIRPRVRW